MDFMTFNINAKHMFSFLKVANGGTLASVKNPVSFSTIGELAQKFLAPAGALAIIIAVALVIYGGFLYTTSMGEEGKIKKAMAVIKAALIGLAIVLLAFVIVDFFKGLLGV